MVHRKGLEHRRAAHRCARADALLLRAVLARLSDLAAAAAAGHNDHRRAHRAVCRAAGAAGRRAVAAAPPLRAAGLPLVCRQPAFGHGVLGAASGAVFYLLCSWLRGLCLGAGKAPLQRCPLPCAAGAGGGNGLLRSAGHADPYAGAAAGLLAVGAAAAPARRSAAVRRCGGRQPLLGRGVSALLGVQVGVGGACHRTECHCRCAASGGGAYRRRYMAWHGIDME